MKEFTKALGTTRQLSIAYHPQTDDQTERINQEVGMFLRHYCYDLKLKGLSNKTTLILSNTRELDRVLSTE